jgi:predicted transcriptional regulator
MSKKRYTLYLSRPLARKFDLLAQQRNGAKSALVEEALRASLEPRQHEGLDDGLARRLNELNKAVARQATDQNVATETLALLVRYFLTVMPPIPESDQESARLTGRRRFEIFLAEVGRRVAEGRRHAAEVLQSVPIDQPDLFAAAPGDALLKRPSAVRNVQLTSNGHAAKSEEDIGHG